MARFTRSLPVAALLCALLAAGPIAMADNARDPAALEAAAQAWMKAFNARDVGALAARATAGVVLIDASTSSPISGRDAVHDAWVRAVSAADGQITSTTKEAAIAGDVAWRIVAYASKQADGTVASRGQALEIWTRSRGEWKLHRQMSSGLLAPASLSRPLPSQPVYDKPTN